MAKPFSQFKVKVYGLTDYFDFGKYQNCRVDSIVDSDPGYFVWLAKNTTTKVGDDVKVSLMDKKIKDDYERHLKEEVLPYLKQDMWGFSDMEFDDVPF